MLSPGRQIKKPCWRGINNRGKDNRETAVTLCPPDFMRLCYLCTYFQQKFDADTFRCKASGTHTCQRKHFMENLEINFTAVFKLYNERLILLLLTIKIRLRRDTVSCKALGSDWSHWQWAPSPAAGLQNCSWLRTPRSVTMKNPAFLWEKHWECVLASPTSCSDTTEIATEGTLPRSSTFVLLAI